MMEEPNPDRGFDGNQRYPEDETPLEDTPDEVVDEQVDSDPPPWEVDADVEEEMRIAAAELESQDFPEPQECPVAAGERDSTKAGDS